MCNNKVIHYKEDFNITTLRWVLLFSFVIFRDYLRGQIDGKWRKLCRHNDWMNWIIESKRVQKTTKRNPWFYELISVVINRIRLKIMILKEDVQRWHILFSLYKVLQSFIAGLYSIIIYPPSVITPYSLTDH